MIGSFPTEHQKCSGRNLLGYVRLKGTSIATQLYLKRAEQRTCSLNPRFAIAL